MGNRPATAPAFVEGLDASAYGIARSLGRNGISTIALDGKNKDFLRFSRYCLGCHTFPNDPHQQRTYADDIIPNEQELYELLVKWGKVFDTKPVLFATSDWFARFLCNCQKELESSFLFHWVPKDVFTTITDKGLIAEFCEKAGLHVPVPWLHALSMMHPGSQMKRHTRAWSNPFIDKRCSFQLLPKYLLHRTSMI